MSFEQDQREGRELAARVSGGRVFPAERIAKTRVLRWDVPGGIQEQQRDGVAGGSRMSEGGRRRRAGDLQPRRHRKDHDCKEGVIGGLAQRRDVI